MVVGFGGRPGDARGGQNKTGLSDLHSFSLLRREEGRKEGRKVFSYINIYVNIYCHSWTCVLAVRIRTGRCEAGCNASRAERPLVSVPDDGVASR